MEVNINASCSFVATEAGAAIWNAQYIGLNIPEEYLPNVVKAGDTVKTQLWVVMAVFGPHTHMGMPQTHFVLNILNINPLL